MVNSIASGFAKETEKDKVRVNTVCIHMGVNWLGESVNALGQKGADTTDCKKIAKKLSFLFIIFHHFFIICSFVHHLFIIFSSFFHHFFHHF